MKKFVVTITREFGSMGRPIAKKLAELLGVEYYDRDIVEASAKKLDLPVSVISNEEEKSSGFLQMVFPLGTESPDRQNQIFQTQAGIITALAAKESCIIVGRCADYILEDEEDAMHVYIYASYEKRLENCKGPLGMKEDVARKMISDVDKARVNYHKRFAKFLPGDPAHKHLIINSGLLGVDETAQILAEVVRIRYAE